MMVGFYDGGCTVVVVVVIILLIAGVEWVDALTHCSCLSAGCDGSLES